MNHTSITLSIRIPCVEVRIRATEHFLASVIKILKVSVCVHMCDHTFFFKWEALEGLHSRAQKLGVETTIMMDLGGPLLLRC